MRLFHRHWKQLILGFVVVSGLPACDSDTADKIVDSISTNRQANISFVNALDEMATFYEKTNTLNRSVFDDEQRAADVMQGEVGDFTFKWFDSSTEDSKFGVEDTNTRDKRVSINLDIDNNASYWMIAWLDSENFQLTGFKKSPSNQTDRFSVRVFANTALEVRINESNDIVATTEKGKVTAPFGIENCASGLDVGGNFIEFCNQAEFGKSYLVVVDSNGKIVVAEEE